MPTVPINYLAVLAAAVSSMLVGFLWYGPLFGKTWMKLAGVSMSDAPKGVGKLYAIQFVGSLVMAYVLAHALVFASVYMKAEGLNAGLMAGFWNWLGFVAPVTLGTVLWDGKPWKLWILNNAHYLIALCVMGIILALWK